MAIPHSLFEIEKLNVLPVTVGGQELVIFYKKGTASALDKRALAEGQDVGAAGVFDPVVDGTMLRFRFEEGWFVDEQTGTVWNLLGIAESGPLAGKALKPLPHQNGFWFAWAVFKPNTRILPVPQR